MLRLHLLLQLPQLLPFGLRVHAEVLGDVVVLGRLQLQVPDGVLGPVDGLHVPGVLAVLVWLLCVAGTRVDTVSSSSLTQEGSWREEVLEETHSWAHSSRLLSILA